MLLLGLVGLTAAAGDVQVELTFDSTVVRRGDVAYCEVRVTNRSEEPRVLAGLAAGGNVWLNIELMGLEFAEAPPIACWPTGGGGLVGGFEKETVPSRGSMATWVQVPLFTANALRQVRGYAQRATVAAGYQSDRLKVRSKPINITIDGDISKSPNEVDLVGLLYVPYKDHPKMDHASRQRLHRVPLLRHMDSLSESPWTMSVPSRLDWLQRQLVPESAMHRCVAITRSLQNCVSVAETDKRKAVADVARELARCGAAERQWFIRYIRLRFSESLDFTSGRLFKEAFPASVRRYDVCTPTNERN